MNEELSIEERMLMSHEHGLEDLKKKSVLPRSSYHCAEVGCLYSDVVTELRKHNNKEGEKRLNKFYRACVKSNTIEDCKKATEHLNI